MNVDERIQSFNPNLKIAFVKMILGINVKITDEFRKKWGKENLGQWFFIQHIKDDESIQICGQNHDIFEGARLTDLIL